MNRNSIVPAATRPPAVQPMAAPQTAPFAHPGGLHTLADLDRMRKHVVAGDHPWIDGWNALIQHPKAQLTYQPAPNANMGVSRQRASSDAVAAYLNAIRGYISGDVAYIDHAIAICNAWSAAVTQVPTGTDQPGLNGIYTYQFALVGELLRPQVGNRWDPAEFERFRRMMREYLYPACHDFLVRHNNTGISHYWANWDASCITAIGATGVLCDDRAMFNEAVEYFKHGAGNGSIQHAVYAMHPGHLGQWQETGRDAEHNALGLGLLAVFCQIAENQGLDLFGYDNNRLLSGAEYIAKYTLWEPVPYTRYNNCDNVNQYWASDSGRGRLQRPIWELLYNHYVIEKGLSSPYLTKVAALNRPEAYVHDDHFGFGSLLFSLKPSEFPPLPVPTVPTDLAATASVGRVYLHWALPKTANGFVVRRSTAVDGPYTEVARFRGVIPEYDDTSVTNGTTYYYVVAAENQAGSSGPSTVVIATPQAVGALLPSGWSRQDVGSVATAGEVGYCPAGDGTFMVRGAGSNIGGAADGVALASTTANGDVVLTARLIDLNLKGARPGSRVGIMIRSSLEPAAPAVALVLGDLGYREARFGSRASAGASMTFVEGNAYTGPAQFPTWFRLQRSGDTFTAYQSHDGRVWYKVGSSTVSMPPQVHAGIAVASGTGSTNAISLTVDHLTVKSISTAAARK